MSQNHGAVNSRPAGEDNGGPSARVELIDAHCHLEEGYYKDAEGVAHVIERARAAGVTPLVAVGASGILQGAHEALNLAARTCDVFAAIGIHPCEVHQAQDAHMEELAELLQRPKVVALGEVGLDYYHDSSTQNVQVSRFKEFVALANQAQKPLMLHIRDAHDDCLALLDATGLPQQGAMIHCFTAGPEVAQAYLHRGLYLSIPGVVTFKNARDLQAAVPLIPQDRLLLETDSPYLTPAPHRGKTNEPMRVRHIAEAVANLRKESLQDVARATTANARAFFGLSQMGQRVGTGV